eukprot:285551-Amphidinium_carterae.1
MCMPVTGADEGASARFRLRLKPKMKELIEKTCFETSALSANASTREPDFSYALLDSGATHVILNLSKLSSLEQHDGRSIGLRLAAGKQV